MAGGPSPALVRSFRNNLIVGGTNAIVRGVREAVRTQVPEALRILADSFSQRALPRGQLADVNRQIARDAQQAVVAGWHSRLPRGNSGGALTGTLGAALASDAMTAGTSDRVISFANTSVLDAAAKHWYRINYGAAGPNLSREGGHDASAFTININGRPFVVLKDDAPPAAVSWLPKVFQWTPDNRMIVLRGPARPIGKGSRAAHFIDLGLAVVAQETGPKYDQFLRQWLADPSHVERLAKKGIIFANLRLDSYGYTVSVH